MYPTLSCAGVGLYANFDSGIESNACAMLRCIAAIRLRNAVVMGLAGGVADGGWAARAIGATSASIAKRDSLIRAPVGMAKDCYTARESGFPQSMSAGRLFEERSRVDRLDHRLERGVPRHIAESLSRFRGAAVR